MLAALTVVVEGENVPTADPLPAAYRSRWRRAGLLELLDGDPLVEDDGRWGPA